jgi:GT2 family glycosyltransferase
MRVNETTRLVAGHRPPIGAYDADIIILSLGRLSETLDAIHSALAQRGVTLHVTVLDQGSEPEIIRALAQTFSKAANFVLYASETNLGVAGGRNLATSLGHGRIIIALDNDALFENNWVAAKAARLFAKEPDLGALGFNILNTDGAHPNKFSWGYPATLLPRFKERFDTTTFVGAGHAIRRVTWNVAGGYDPAFFFTWEEYDFCLTAIALNWRICYDGSLAVIHKVSPNARIGWDEARMTHFVRNRLIISRKWGASWIDLTPRVVGYLVKALLNKRVAATLRGIHDAFWADIPHRRRMTRTMRDYLYTNETRHRGSWLNRLRTEVFGRVNTAP